MVSNGRLPRKEAIEHDLRIATKGTPQSDASDDYTPNH